MKSGNATFNATDRAKWRGAPLRSRLEHMKTIFVKHGTISAILSTIEDELLEREAQSKSVGILLLAGSGSGKSSLLRFLERVYPDEITTTLTRRRVVLFKVPHTLTPKSMSSALLRALGDPTFDQGSPTEMMERVEYLLNEVGTQIVGLDDFQDVPAKRGTRGVEAISNWVRDLCDMEFPGVILAVGTHEAAVVRDSHPQLKRRMQTTFHLPVFSMDTKEASNSYATLLKLIDAALPLAEESKLAEMFARPLLAASGGILDYLMKLLVKATVRAFKRGSERIERADLKEAFNLQHQVAAIGGNPFAEEWDGNPLTSPGQIFQIIDSSEKSSSEKKGKKK